MSKTWRLMGRAFSAWNASNALEWGAALAYYTAFSIAPLFIIALSVVGVFVKGDNVPYLQSEIAELIGNSAAVAVLGAIHSIHSSVHGKLANIIGVLVLLIGASGAFVQLQTTLNRIWCVRPKPGHFWKDLVKQRLISFAMILSISFLLLVSLIISSILAAVTGYFEYLLPVPTFYGAFWMRSFRLRLSWVYLPRFSRLFPMSTSTGVMSGSARS